MGIASKVCRKCGLDKPFGAFTKHKTGRHGYRSQCRACDAAYHQTRDKAHIAKRALAARAHALALDPEARRWESIKRKYKVTKDQWLTLWDSQNHKCACCGRDPLEGEIFDTEHCHATKKVRGICCHRCNIVLGNLGDTLKQAEARAAQLLWYLERTSG